MDHLVPGLPERIRLSMERPKTRNRKIKTGEWADAIGYSLTSIYRYLKKEPDERTDPSPQDLGALSRLTGYSTDWYIFGEEAKEGGRKSKSIEIRVGDRRLLSTEVGADEELTFIISAE